MIALQYISALIVKSLCENQMHYESKDAKSMHYHAYVTKDQCSWLVLSFRNR